jgi:DNA-binding MarR family transcriptional regulator
LYRLSSSLSYLLNRAGVRMGELFSQELAICDLTLPMYRVLAALTDRQEQRLSDLSVATSIEITTLSRLVTAMQKRRLVLRRRPDGDLRTVQISLTIDGRELADKFMPRAQYYETVATLGLGPADTERLKAVLTGIYENLGEIEPLVFRDSGFLVDHRVTQDA